MTARLHRRFTFDEYLQVERAAPDKSEFVRGEIFAMVGCTARHSKLSLNLGTALSVRLRGKPCQPFGSDLRLFVPEHGIATYPDAMVICGPLSFHAAGPADTVLNPTAIFEVLSPSTEAFDRGDKFVAYRSIASLKHYVLVEQRRPVVEVFSPDAAGSWSNRIFQGAGSNIELPALSLTLPMDELTADAPP